MLDVRRRSWLLLYTRRTRDFPTIKSFRSARARYPVSQVAFYSTGDDPDTSPKRKRGFPRLRFGLVWLLSQAPWAVEHYRPTYEALLPRSAAVPWCTPMRRRQGSRDWSATAMCGLSPAPRRPSMCGRPNTGRQGRQAIRWSVSKASWERISTRHSSVRRLNLLPCLTRDWRAVAGPTP